MATYFSKGRASAATDLKESDNFTSGSLRRSFLNLTVKILRKLVHICGGYRKNKRGLLKDTVYIIKVFLPSGKGHDVNFLSRIALQKSDDNPSAGVLNTRFRKTCVFRQTSRFMSETVSLREADCH